MGKPVQIVGIRHPRPSVVRFEIDRSLTGTGHEQYDAKPVGNVVRPPDVLAVALFDTGLVSSVHVFSNVITISRAVNAGSSPGPTGTGNVEWSEIDKLQEVIEKLFVHYLPGVIPTPV
jgi:hypothetical protein